MTSQEKHTCRDDNRIISDIEKYGLSVIILEATEYLPSFAYSIGLWGKFAPKAKDKFCFYSRKPGPL
jgi:hypothetical protein